MRLLAILAACLIMGACTTTNVRQAAASHQGVAERNSKGLLIQPDVQLSLLTAAGLQEQREDWSRDAQAHLTEAMRQELQSRSHPFEVLDPRSSMEGRTGQLLRLHEAVGESIRTYEYSGLKLPTKKGTFDWTLGEGARTLREARGADYALFVTARGSYASAGRKAVMVGAAILGVSVPLGSQQVMASLVDLRSGRVIWFNVAIAGPSADMRSSEGATALVKDLLKDVPV